MDYGNLGYQLLIDTYSLPARPLTRCARIDSSIKGRSTTTQRNKEILLFEPAYASKNTLSGHLQFALKYEGVNLEILALLFQRAGGDEIQAWLIENPESKYARRIGFLFEWLTRKSLNAKVSSKSRYVDVLDTRLQFGMENGSQSTKFRVTDNLPGNRDFCPLVRRTPFLAKKIKEDIKQKIQQTINRYDPDLLSRAANFLYLKETQSSFEVEREKPTADRAQRFANLLQNADIHSPLTMSRLIELQNTVADPRLQEAGWRTRQNWLGRNPGYRSKMDFVPPRPEDVPMLMVGLLNFSEKYDRLNLGIAQDNKDNKDNGMDPVVFAATVSFGFVFIHPFMDGNGRIHRYLIHDMLAKTEFTPSGIVLPVSAVILANLSEYIRVLEAFSQPLLQITQFDSDMPHLPATGNDALYFRYFDCTVQAEFLYQALERTVKEDLQKEIDFLIGYEKSRIALNELLDWPGQSLNLFIRCADQNSGRISKAKREAHFGWMTDQEVADAEKLIANSFP